MKTYYEVLQVAETASLGVLRAAWIALNREYHPDRRVAGMSEKEQNLLCQFVNEAYQVLSDPAKRAAYDEDLRSKRRVYEMPPQQDGSFNPDAYPDPYRQPTEFTQDLLVNAARVAGSVFQKHVLDGLPKELRTVIENAIRNRRKSA